MNTGLSKGTVLILGAGSDIGMAIAHHYAVSGHAIVLAARRPDALATAADDLRLRHGGQVSVVAFDVLDTGSHAAFLDGLPDLPQIAVCAVGLMGDQVASERDMEAAALVMRSNFEGPASILGLIANRMEARGWGQIVGISSVAGLRGRATNYVYGAAKAGFTAWLSGLRNRLAGRGVQVLTVLPGFVNTRMTEGMDLPARLTAEPDEVARAVARALERGRDVVYVRRIWWVIMTIIRAIPERIFKKMSI